jgi:hypothetical protein
VTDGKLIATVFSPEYHVPLSGGGMECQEFAVMLIFSHIAVLFLGLILGEVRHRVTKRYFHD